MTKYGAWAMTQDIAMSLDDSATQSLYAHTTFCLVGKYPSLSSAYSSSTVIQLHRRSTQSQHLKASVRQYQLHCEKLSRSPPHDTGV
eukprot:6204860-Pleurochrysis_carterae.AAC.2